MAQIKPHTLSGFMELLPQPQLQMEAIMEVLRRTSIMASICSCGCGSSSINPESVCGLICAMVVSSL